MNSERSETKHKAPKKKIPGKKLNLADHKKSLYGGGLVAIIAIAGLVGGIIILKEVETKRGGGIITWGIQLYPDEYDPFRAFWMYRATTVRLVAQVAEGLLRIEGEGENSHLSHNHQFQQ